MSHSKPNKEGKPPTKDQKANASVEKIDKLSFNPIEKKCVNYSASASCSAASNTVNQQTYSHYISADALTAEILLAMKCFVSHYSKKSMDDFLDLVQILFPDSEIVNEISLKRTKIIYVINYCLKEYMDKVKKAACFTICFDEALNNISCWKQLDAHTLVFDEY